MSEMEIDGGANQLGQLGLDGRVRELRDRLLFAADFIAPARGKYSWLEKRTGIAASKWQNLYLEKQLPTVEMLLAVVHLEPHYAKWILTGLPNLARMIEKVSETLGDEAAGNIRQIAEVWRDETPESQLWKDWREQRRHYRRKKTDGDKEE
ncbi:hypothetical protein [Caballeronia zhejiangensis]|uniref:hypothetical protein n=1 Tax=Caballeronia zhejiangensis TaxID=871203 RepID=UPI00158BB308|nr:hypothetical protein [Caballeronia zhejiangensis]MCI1042245.1 hypothetical protein [Caballeronia zhejiangensis]